MSGAEALATRCVVGRSLRNLIPIKSTGEWSDRCWLHWRWTASGCKISPAHWNHRSQDGNRIRRGGLNRIKRRNARSFVRREKTAVSNGPWETHRFELLDGADETCKPKRSGNFDEIQQECAALWCLNKSRCLVQTITDEPMDRWNTRATAERQQTAFEESSVRFKFLVGARDASVQRSSSHATTNHHGAEQSSRWVVTCNANGRQASNQVGWGRGVGGVPTCCYCIAHPTHLPLSDRTYTENKLQPNRSSLQRADSCSNTTTARGGPAPQANSLSPPTRRAKTLTIGLLRLEETPQTHGNYHFFPTYGRLWLAARAAPAADSHAFLQRRPQQLATH